MRKLIVSNFVTLDGYYEGKDKSINSLLTTTMKCLISSDPDVRWIMRENLKKKRLERLDSEWVKR